MDKQTALQFQPTARADAVSSARCARCERRFRAGAQFCPFDGEPLEASDESSDDELIGTVIDGRFEVLSLLGEGGMGIVYRVRHRVLGREFALKALRADVAREEHLGERFLREAQSAASINHPNVCEITDFGELPGQRPYFVMELLSGVSLSRLLATRLPLERVVHLTEQIARALDAAHRAGVVHRDLKPENVIVDQTPTEERIKVVDFGLAQIVGQSRLTQPGIVFGTPHYMSPEQASGGDADPRADIYALGVILYEMLTGKVPFEAETYMGVLSKHLYLEPVPPSKLVPDAPIGALESVVLRCLKKSRDERYSSMAELLEDLKRIVRVDAGRVSFRPGELQAVSGPASSVGPASSPERNAEARRGGRGAFLLGVGLAVGLSLVVWRRPWAFEPPVRLQIGAIPSLDAPAFPRALAFGPVGDVASHAGGTTTAHARPQRAGAASSEPQARPDPSVPPTDPSAGDTRPPRTKRRADFQTSEIIDPWSQ